MIGFPRRGRAVVLVWFGLAGLVLCLLVVWRGGGWAQLLAVGWAAAGAFLWRRMAGVRIGWDDAGRLQVCSGRLLPLQITVAAGAVLRCAVASTPLLRRMGCRIVTLFTLHGQLILPGLAAGDAAALCEAVCPPPRQPQN